MDYEPGTTLTIDELVLRPWRPEDAPAVLEVCQDPEIARWVTIAQPFGPADADALISDGLAMWRDGTGAAFAVVEAATDRLLGAVTRFGPDGHEVTFGLWLVPEARGCGVGTRALRLVSDWTFATTELSATSCSSWSATSRHFGRWSAPASSERASSGRWTCITGACQWTAWFFSRLRSDG